MILTKNKLEQMTKKKINVRCLQNAKNKINLKYNIKSRKYMLCHVEFTKH